MRHLLILILLYSLSSLHAQNETWRDDYRQVMDFEEGLAAVWHHNGKWGFVNKKGKVIIPEDFYNNVETDYLNRGTIRVFRNDKVGLSNLEGKQLLPMIFDSIEPFVYENDNETEVVFEGKSFHIDKTGKCVRDCQNAPKY